MASVPFAWYTLPPVQTLHVVLRLAIMVLVGALLGACDRPPPVPRKVQLARLPAKVVPGSWSVSSDLVHTAFQVHGTDGIHIVRDGLREADWQTVSTRSFAPNTDRLFYWVRAPDGTTALVADGQVVPVGLSRHEYLVFDPSGAHWAVVAAAPVVAGQAADPDARIVVVADGTVRGRHRDASVPAWSHDGAHLAWVAVEPAEGERSQMRLLVDGAVRHAADMTPGPCLPPVQTVPEGAGLPADARALFLSDGRVVALLRDGDGWGVFRNGERLAHFDANVPVSSGGPVLTVESEACRTAATVVTGSLVVAADAPVVAWWERVAGSDDRWRVMIDGAPADDVTCVRPWEAQPPVLSSDGRSWAYPCFTRFDASGQDVDIVTRGGRYGPHVEIYGVVLSDDGRRVGYGATASAGGDWTLYADGVAFPHHYYSIWRPRFDPSGRHLAWEGQHTRGGRGVVVLDGRDLASFDDLLDGPTFLAPDHVSWVVRRNRRLTRLTFPLS